MEDEDENNKLRRQHLKRWTTVASINYCNDDINDDDTDDDDIIDDDIDDDDTDDEEEELTRNHRKRKAGAWNCIVVAHCTKKEEVDSMIDQYIDPNCKYLFQQIWLHYYTCL